MVLPPISDDEAALLRGVCLDPWDDLPRLVLADWYEERGQGERAELIRAACAAAIDPSEAARARSQAAVARLLIAGGGGQVRRLAGGLADLLGDAARGWPTRARYAEWDVFEAAAEAGLWGRVPVTAAEWTRAGPTRFTFDDASAGREWGWVRRGSVRPGGVPPRVFDRLARPGGPVGTGDTLAVYDTPGEAAEALSRAMVDEGRAAVGLPPLAWPAFPDRPA